MANSYSDPNDPNMDLWADVLKRRDPTLATAGVTSPNAGTAGFEVPDYGVSPNVYPEPQVQSLQRPWTGPWETNPMNPDRGKGVTPAAANPPQAGQFSNNNQGFLDWATQKYGPDPTRGRGFVNAQAGGGIEAMLKAYRDATGNTATFQGGPSGDRVDFGQGTQDALTAGGQIWNAAGGSGGAGGASRGGGGGIPGGGSGEGRNSVPDPGSFTPRPVTGPTNPNTGRSDALYDLLMGRAKQGLDIDRNDPIIRNQSDAYSAQQQRARKDYLSDAAERGGSTANIGAEARSSAEKVGQNTGAFEASLMGQELAARRQEIQSALNGAMGFLTQQQQLQLQEELANLELAQRESQFGRTQSQSESQFGRTLAQRAIEEGNMDAWRNSPLYG